MKLRSPLRICCFTILLPLAVSAQTVLIEDTFDGGDRKIANLPSSAAWFSPNAGQLDVVDAGGGNKVLRIAGDAPVLQAAAFFTPVKLAVGERLAASLRFTPTSEIQKGPGLVRIALVSDAPVQNRDRQQPAVMGGYSVWLSGESNGARFYKRSDMVSGILTTARGWNSLAGTMSPQRRFAWKPNQTYSIGFVIERVAETKMRLTYTILGGDAPFRASFEDTAATDLAFNALAVGVHSSLAGILVDDVYLEYSGRLAVAAPALAAPAAPVVTFPVQLGTRTVEAHERTVLGAPVIPMWDAPMPRDGLVAAGFPRAEQAEHFVVWEATREEGAFNHHAALVHHDGLFFAMWSNHPQGEDAPGQRVLYATSRDAETWTPPRELFPPPGEVKNRGQPGRSLRPDRWAVVDGTLYAISYYRAPGVPSHPVARSLTASGQMGEPFLLRPLSNASDLPQFMQHNPASIEPPPVAAAIRRWYVDNDVVSWWAQSEGLPREGIDRANLIEPFLYRNRDGRLTLMMRSHSTPASRARGMAPRNNRIYVSYQKENGEWDTPYPTNIPDAPSRSEALRLPDGSILLIGNQIAPQFDARLYLPRHTLTTAVSRDGYRFTQVMALRHSAPTTYRFEGIEGRTLGFGYPSSILHNGTLYSLYSVGKEDIAITRVPLRK